MFGVHTIKFLRRARHSITKFIKGIISIIILLNGHTSLTRHTAIDAWEQCNHTRKTELNRHLVHALEQPPIWMYYGINITYLLAHCGTGAMAYAHAHWQAPGMRAVPQCAYNLYVHVIQVERAHAYGSSFLSMLTSCPGR